MTRDKILEAAALEIERNGLTQFRVKRVASEANISIALLYSYFEDREDLIAATVVYRFRQVLVGLAVIFTTPLQGVETTDGLRAALKVMICEAQLPLRTEARILRIESMSFAGHNPTASTGIAAATTWRTMKSGRSNWRRSSMANSLVAPPSASRSTTFSPSAAVTLATACCQAFDVWATPARYCASRWSSF